MATEVRWRRGTAAQTAAFTGAPGEVTVNTTSQGLHIHDGTTPGGHPVPAASDLAAVIAAVSGKQDALGFTPENAANKGATNGYAPLVGGLVPLENLPAQEVAEPDNVAITYNGNGSIATVVEDGVTSTFTYNGNGTINTVARPIGSLTRTETFGYTGANLTSVIATEA